MCTGYTKVNIQGGGGGGGFGDVLRSRRKKYVVLGVLRIDFTNIFFLFCFVFWK